MKEFLHNIITEAGQITLEYKKKLSSLEINKKSEKDLVTEADIAVEKFLNEQIKSRYPDHGILGEEGGEQTGNEYRWIIDPIDGTTSFFHDLPFYSVSIAIEKEGQIILGAVNAPVLGELFEAEKGKGAFLNGRHIHVSNCTELSDCVLGTGFACVKVNKKHNNLPYFNHIVTQIRGIRRLGSAALDLCYVACGRFDGFWELNLKIYDAAAGGFILEEAGGKISDFTNKNYNLYEEMIGTNGLIHEKLTDMFTDIKKQNHKLIN